MASFFQKAWRSVIGKASILDQNPLRSATTIPEANWNRRWIKRSGDANSDPSPIVREAVRFIREFSRSLEDPEFNYRPAFISALRLIRRIETDTPHAQMALELTNYVKKLVRRYRVMTDREAIELNDSIPANIEEANVMAHVEEASRRAAAANRAVARMGEALRLPEVSNANVEEFMRAHGTASAAAGEAEPVVANNANLEEFMRVHGSASASASGEEEISDENLAAAGLTRANWDELVQGGPVSADAGVGADAGATSKGTRRRKRTLRMRRGKNRSRRNQRH